MNENKITRRGFLRGTAYAGMAAFTGAGFMNTRAGSIVAETIDVKIAGLHHAFDGCKIALLSDFHSSWIVPDSLMRSACDLAMQHKPDIIALTGDYISGGFNPFRGSWKAEDEHLDRLFAAVSVLNAPMGIFAVLGNHDFWVGPEPMARTVDVMHKTIGVTWLRNSNITIEKNGGRLDILGVDDYWEASCSPEKAYAGLGPETPKILLSHNPDVNLYIRRFMRIDLVLCGHTHGGQIVLPFIGMPLVPSHYGQKYRAGLVRDGDTQTYTTRGVGHLLIPVRILCPPEVTILTLRA